MEILCSLGLSVSFLVLAGVVMWMMTLTKGIADWKKSIMIVVVLWYGLVVYHTPGKMKGWPYNGVPEVGVLLSWKVIEPQINPRDGGIYLWMVPKEDKDEKEGFLKSLIPSHIFTPESTSIPRGYKIPYSVGEHKRLSEAAEKLKKGDVMLFRSGGKTGGKRGRKGRGQSSKGQYEILKFNELVKKEEGVTNE